MSRTSRTALILISLIFGRDQVEAAANHTPTPSSRSHIIPHLSELRSAYLLRSGAVRYDSTAMSPDGICLQIQRHFDVVLRLLLAATPRSIETALDRLESSSDSKWSSQMRDRWRGQLLTNRCIQLMRLAVYRNRGVFPQNEGQANGLTAPIFVDHHDTACAVGHLMRLSGWQQTVASICRSNNLVYVPDAVRSQVAQWVLNSGLTLEEASLIQPGYPLRVEYDMSDFAPGGQALVRNGLRFENFDIDSEFFSQFGGQVADESEVGIGVGVGDYFDEVLLSSIRPNGTHWIAIGGAARTELPYPVSITPRYLNAFKADPLPIDLPLLIRFDVASIKPGSLINQLTQHVDSFQGGFYTIEDMQGDPYYSMTTSILENGATITSTALDSTTPQTSSMDFQPRKHITVETRIVLRGGVGIDAYALDFNVITVPEPETISILLSLLVCSILEGFNCRRRSF
jgi:hypothetical protein